MRPVSSATSSPNTASPALNGTPGRSRSGLRPQPSMEAGCQLVVGEVLDPVVRQPLGRSLHPPASSCHDCASTSVGSEPAAATRGGGSDQEPAPGLALGGRRSQEQVHLAGGEQPGVAFAGQRRGVLADRVSEPPPRRAHPGSCCSFGIDQGCVAAALGDELLVGSALHDAAPSSTMISSQSRMVLRRCATMTQVVPRRRRLRSMRCSVSVSSALVASSSTTMLGSRARARAISRRWRCPPLKFRPPSATSDR